MVGTANARFRRIDAVLDAVLDLPTAAQAAFIDGACAGDAELRDEVIRLVRAHHRSASVFDGPALRLAPPLFEGLGAPVIPESIGPFRVVRVIGEGGMGTVFLGERSDGQFDQRVALKVIRHPIAGLVRRFLEERRILARLEHPHIARLIDGGVTATGLPYFAMEFVDGVRLDRFCDARNLSLDERLALFETVCDAVSYAHRHVIVHRDLKPANILVTPDGQVKLLDFGIAKLLDAQDGWTSPDDTRTGAQVMTPDVAAPEQVLGRPISTATDVYALGVLLYILIAGERPYDVRGKSPAEIERIICEDEPPSPSAKAPAALRRRIRGDLDLIVLKALQKEPQRRYHSAAELAQDIARFRQGCAIVARPDSVRYRTGKFVGRHRAGVAAAVVLMAAVAGGATRERILRHHAEVEARKATEVETFLIGVFDVADPFAWSERDRGTITARDLLDRGAKRIDSTLVSEPEVQAELRAVLGRVYMSLGFLDKATPLLQRSLAQRMTLRGAQDSSVAANMDLLGTALGKQDKFAQAEPLLRAALEQRRRLFGNTNNETAESLEHLGTLLADRQHAAAESLFRQNLAIRQRLFGDSAVELTSSLNELGLARFRMGDYAEAEALFRRALDIDLRRLGEQHPTTAETMQNLAMTLQNRGRMEEAERYYRRALASERAALGNGHPSVTTTLSKFGVFLADDLGRLDEAEAMIREALALDRKTFGDHHSSVADGLRYLGSILSSKGQFAAADSALRQSLSIDRAVFGDRHETVADAYDLMAFVRSQLGDLDEAVRLGRESVARYRELYGDKHYYTLISTANLAGYLTQPASEAVLGARIRPTHVRNTRLVVEGAAEAESLARAVLARLDSANAAHRALSVAVQVTLGAAILAQHRGDEALPILARALDLSRQHFGERSLQTARARLAYGKALVVLGRFAEAAPMLRAAQATLEKHRVDHPRLAAQASATVAILTARSVR